MSIRWVLFWTHRLLSPTKPQTLAEQTAPVIGAI